MSSGANRQASPSTPPPASRPTTEIASSASFATPPAQPSPPTFARGRLEVRGDGRVKWSLRRPWRDGTRAFVFDPLTFLERLVAPVPHPREHQWTYFGVLAPASPLRDAVVPCRTVASSVPSRGPSPAPGIGEAEPEADPCAKDSARAGPSSSSGPSRWTCCAALPCGGRRVATLTDPLIARRILEHLRLRAEPPPLRRTRAAALRLIRRPRATAARRPIDADVPPERGTFAVDEASHSALRPAAPPCGRALGRGRHRPSLLFSFNPSIRCSARWQFGSRPPGGILVPQRALHFVFVFALLAVTSSMSFAQGPPPFNQLPAWILVNFPI